MRIRTLTGLLLTAAWLAAAPAAHALSLGLTTAAGALSPFKTGSTATSTAALTVVSVTPWTLQVADTTSTSNAGHLARQSGCSSGVATLSNPLQLTATPGAGTGTSAGQKSLSGSPQTVATGPLGTSLVSVAYSQTIPSSELVVAGCTYSITVTYTAS